MSGGYTVSVPKVGGGSFQFGVQPRTITFGLGANGTGKSSFVSMIAKNNVAHVTRLSGNRDVTLSSSAIGITGASRNQFEQFFKSDLTKESSRYYTQNSRNMTESILYDLKELHSFFISQNYNKLTNTEKNSTAEKDSLKKIRENLSPLAKVQDILTAGGIKFHFFYDNKGKLVAKRPSGKDVFANMLSDGERAALLMASRVITAPNGQLILLDEPERHLHRSISAPLIRALQDYREDCSFMIVTHDLSLPRDFPDSKILLFREFIYPNKWRLEQIDDLSKISEDVAEAILGSKDKLLFVEGQKNSLDFSLYSILYENCTVQPVNNCAAVMSMTKSVIASTALHRIDAYGIIDNDQMSEEKISKLKEDNIFAIKVHSVEGLYYHPETILLISEYLKNTGFNLPDSFLESVSKFIIEGFNEKKLDYIVDAQMRKIREFTFQTLPKKADIKNKASWSISHDSPNIKTLMEHEESKMGILINNGDIERLVTTYNIKRSGIPDKISKLMGLSDRVKYEDLVRSRARKDPEFKAALKNLVGIDF